MRVFPVARRSSSCSSQALIILPEIVEHHPQLLGLCAGKIELRLEAAQDRVAVRVLRRGGGRPVHLSVDAELHRERAGGRASQKHKRQRRENTGILPGRSFGRDHHPYCSR